MSYIAYLDCSGGIDGETFLAALFDAGLSLDVLRQKPSLFPLHDYDISLEHVPQSGVLAARVVVSNTSEKQTTYTWTELEHIVAAQQISTHIWDTTLKILRHLAKAQAIVEQKTVNEQVYEINVSDLLTIISIVIGLKELDIGQVYASTLPLSIRDVSYSHNATAFATAIEILRSTKAAWKPTNGEDFLVTPIGAALLAVLARFDAPTMTIERVAHGVSGNVQAVGSMLHLYLGSLQQQGLPQHIHGDAETDWITVLSTNIDNMSGEILGGLMDRLLDAGALDVSYTPMQMKKNRPATMLMIVCPLEKGDELAYLLLRETTTLGVRVQQVQRLKAQRFQQQIVTSLGPILVKVKRLGTQIISAAPEFEECQRVARERNMPLADVYAVTQKEIANTLFDGLTKPE